MPPEERQADDGPADEVEQGVGGGRHHARPRGVAESPLDPELLAEGRAAAHLHGQVGHLDRRLAAAALTSRTRSMASSRPVSRAARVSARRARDLIGSRCASGESGRAVAARPASGRGGPGGSRSGASRVSATTASISPSVNAAFRTRNHGSTRRAMSSPAPSAPSIASRATVTSVARDGARARCRAGRSRRSGRRCPARPSRDAPATASWAPRPPAGGSTTRSCPPRSRR